MKLMFELSKEHATLPSAEVIATLNAEHINASLISSNEDVLIVETNPNDNDLKRLAERLAFTFVIDELLFSCPTTLNEIIQNAEKHQLPPEGSIAIRCKNRSSHIRSEQLIDQLGDIYTKKRTVNLTKPDIEVRAVITEDTAYLGIKKADLDTSHFQQRRGHLRPFLSPITLHPKIARAMVNLSQVKKHQTLLDPFCGTGGILLEAGFIGAQIVGGDIEQKMVDGSQKNLEYYHLKNYRLYCTDIGDIARYAPSVDAIVTDFPYARATTTKGEQLKQLYKRAFETISQILKKNRYAVVGLSNEDIRTIGEQYLSIVATYPVKSHRSLTRYFVVYKHG
ncbi:MAG TPA: THUMP domain-containing protein [Candidatus Thermoplasmatota archaeon]|nr:THUMP domain-containing protein [Candidatus Thermoplasmatota archaeon]